MFMKKALRTRRRVEHLPFLSEYVRMAATILNQCWRSLLPSNQAYCHLILPVVIKVFARSYTKKGIGFQLSQNLSAHT